MVELEDAVTAANSGGDPTIRIAAGTYLLSGVFLRLLHDGITIIGATGNRNDVVLDGGYITT